MLLPLPLLLSLLALLSFPAPILASPPPGPRSSDFTTPHAAPFTSRRFASLDVALPSASDCILTAAGGRAASPAGGGGGRGARREGGFLGKACQDSSDCPEGTECVEHRCVM